MTPTLVSCRTTASCLHLLFSELIADEFSELYQDASCYEVVAVACDPGEPEPEVTSAKINDRNAAEVLLEVRHHLRQDLVYTLRVKHTGDVVKGLQVGRRAFPEPRPTPETRVLHQLSEMNRQIAELTTAIGST